MKSFNALAVLTIFANAKYCECYIEKFDVINVHKYNSTSFDGNDLLDRVKRQEEECK
jgi:hypothetical protein